MVETRFDRGVYEDDEPEEDESSGGGGGGSSSGGGGGSGDDDLNLTENEQEADIVIRDGQIVAADEDARFESDFPTQIIEDDSGGGGGASSSSPSSNNRESSKSKTSSKNNEADIEGPETTAVLSTVTVEDQRTDVELDSGKTVSRADLIQRKADVEGTRVNLENQQDFLESQGREEQAAKLEDDIEKASQAEQDLQQDISNIGKIEEQQEKQQERRRKRQREINKEKPVTGSDGFFTRLDANVANRQQDSFAGFQDSMQRDIDILSNTRGAQFVGRGAAGVESFANEVADAFDVDRDFQSRTDAALFDTRTGRSESTFDDNRPVTEDLEFDQFSISEAPQVTDKRTDELSEAAVGGLASVTAATRNIDDAGEFALSTSARPFTQKASRTADALTEEDLGSDKVSDFDLEEGVIGFGAATVSQAKEDPTEFATGLATDTLTGTAALRGGRQASRAASNAPEAAFTAARKADPATGFGRTPLPGEDATTSLDIASDKLDTFEDFVVGDLEEQVRTTEGKEFIQTTEGVKRRGQETNTIRFNTREGEDGVVIDPQTQDAIETRSISRREFLSDRLEDFEERFIEPNAAGLGPGALVPRQRTRPDVDSQRRTKDLVDDDTSTDVTTPQDRLQDVQEGFEEFSDDLSVARRTDQRTFNNQKSSVDNFVGTLTGTTQETSQEQTPFNEEALDLENPQTFENPQVFDQDQTQSFEQVTSSESPDPFRTEEKVFEEPFRRRETEKRTSRTATDLGFTNDNEEESSGVLDQFSSDKDFRFDSSLGAELTGVTAEERPDAFATQDPFNLRPVLEDSGSGDNDVAF